jgi:hypothetical protein
MASAPMRRTSGLLGLISPSRGGGSEGDAPSPEPDEDDTGGEALQAASDEVFDALKADDRVAFRDALARFVRVESMSGMPMMDDDEDDL